MMITQPKMKIVLPPTNIHRNAFIRGPGFMTRVKRATTPSLGTVNDRSAGGKDAALNSSARESCSVVRSEACSPVPAAAEAVTRLVKTIPMTWAHC